MKLLILFWLRRGGKVIWCLKKDNYKAQNLLLSSLVTVSTIERLTNVQVKNTKFIPSCFGVKEVDNLSELRFSVWGKRTGKGLTPTPKLKFLPPTTEVFHLNALRVHYQACLRNSFNERRPSDMDPCQVEVIVYIIRISLAFCLIF